MVTVTLLVDLKIADTTAFTARVTLKKMGLPITQVKRSLYYRFEVEGDETSFSENIQKADILVNFNKHIPKIETDNLSFSDDAVHVLVEDLESPTGLLSTLKERLGFSMIQAMEAGTLWHLAFDKDAQENAKKAAEELLCNRHYQKYELV